MALRPTSKRSRFATAPIFAAYLLSFLSATVAYAQPILFGSADDPQEQIQPVWWQRESLLDLMGGPSLIGAQWRAASNASLSLVTRSVTARLSSTFRAGIYGEYGPDVDEPYDALRAIEFARYNPPRENPVYIRVGPLERTRLGTGHVVNFFDSQVAWDERTIGAEVAWDQPFTQVSAFTDNLLLDGVVGGRLGVTPLQAVNDASLRSLTVGLGYITDLATLGDTLPELTAYNVDASVDLLESGDIDLTPFATFSWYSDYGSGIGFGADLISHNFIDLARFRVRFALFYNGDAFIPGYVGAFYPVNNTRARIVNSVDFLAENPRQSLVGVSLDEAVGGNDLVTELRLLIFERFEFWYYFRRHYGSQRLSEYHLRLFLRSPERLMVALGIDRGGLRGFASLFNDLGDQTALVFDVDYRIGGPLWVYIRSRYTYEPIGENLVGDPRYLVQRRFEPFIGVRFVL